MFILSNDRNSKLKNFTMLQAALNNIEVNFDMNTAQTIMEAKKGVILRLLYEIRSKLEKKGVNPDNLSLKKSKQKIEAALFNH